MGHIEHDLFIIGDHFEVACGNCQQIRDVLDFQHDPAIEPGPDHPHYSCPQCGYQLPLVLIKYYEPGESYAIQ